MVQYCMYVGGRTPYKMLFSKATGRVFQQDFVPNYGPNFELEKQEAVPFRLTRNLSTFFTNFGVDGSFLTVLSLTAQVGGDRLPAPLCVCASHQIFPCSVPVLAQALCITVQGRLGGGNRLPALLLVCSSKFFPALFLAMRLVLSLRG